MNMSMVTRVMKWLAHMPTVCGQHKRQRKGLWLCSGVVSIWGFRYNVAKNKGNIVFRCSQVGILERKGKKKNFSGHWRHQGFFFFSLFVVVCCAAVLKRKLCDCRPFHLKFFNQCFTSFKAIFLLPKCGDVHWLLTVFPTCLSACKVLTLGIQARLCTVLLSCCLYAHLTDTKPVIVNTSNSQLQWMQWGSFSNGQQHLHTYFGGLDSLLSS